ncbi:MAG: myo-inosose-2 dehydratase [Kiloniellales bacterium]
MRVRFGTNPIAWSNDDLRMLGGATPLDTCLAEAHAAGFEGIELGHKFPREAEALKAVLARHRLDLVSGWYSSALLERDAEAEMKALRPHLELLKALGSKVLILAETTGAVHGNRKVGLAQRPRLKDGQWTEFGRRLTAVADDVAAEGVTLAYHHHMGTVVETEEEIDRLMAASGPSVQLLLDTGHALFAGADPLALAQRYAGRIAHVHCKDVRREVLQRFRAEGGSFLDAVVEGVFTVPGDGHIDYVPILSALEGYGGWLVVEAEQDPVKAPPAHYATLGCRNLKVYAHAAGLH